MKLLRFKINSSFRGLPKGFELKFRENNYGSSDMNEPICFVGLNGSGKSNTLEVICEIFYYLELKTIAKDKELSLLDKKYKELGFEIEYNISIDKWKNAHSKSVETTPFHSPNWINILCKKEINDELSIFEIAVYDSKVPYPVPKNIWREILPSKIIGYSSGQNELISNPFIKLDYYYFDEFVKSTSEKNIASNTDVNRMFFMDYESNELVVLANYLFQGNDFLNRNKKTVFDERLYIQNLHSFSLQIKFRNYNNKEIEFPSELNLGIEKLKKCATTWIDNINELNIKNKKNRTIELDFYVDAAIRKAFRNQFKLPYELFRLLYLLRLMNIHCFNPKTRDEIKHKNIGTNLSDLIPKPASEDLVFNIDGIKFIKSNVIEPVSYKQLSDGEHQLLHVIGTLQLMNEHDVLFILDEPETHFNPDWRAKMIQTIMKLDKDNNNYQDHIITSHSPFIISDCKPNNVYIFNKKYGKIKVETAHEKNLNTFGTSVNILTEEVFDKNESQGDFSLELLNQIKNREYKTLEDIQKAKYDSIILGDSVEKSLLFRKLLLIEVELKKIGASDKQL